MRADQQLKSQVRDQLIPIRLDLSFGSWRLRDSFLWNPNEKSITPQIFAHKLCLDLDFPDFFEPHIAQSIITQVQRAMENKSKRSSQP